MNKVYLYIILIIGAIYLYSNYNKNEEKVILKDHMEPSEEAHVSEEKPVNSDYEKAWTDENVSKNSKFYTADIKDEKTDPGKFFNKQNEFVDITSYKSKDMIPEKCFYDRGELKCQFNNKLQIIPPRLINNPEKNPVILSIGDDKNINTNKVSNDIYSFGGNNYNVWEYGKKEEGGYTRDSVPLTLTNQKINYAM